ncbi:UNVERIFIED_CONTAM: hypothetical protein K2H54_049486 [Gekko kuhli]
MHDCRAGRNNKAIQSDILSKAWDVYPYMNQSTEFRPQRATNSKYAISIAELSKKFSEPDKELLVLDTKEEPPPVAVCVRVMPGGAVRVSLSRGDCANSAMG